MNPEAQAELNRILGLDPNELSEYEAGFLRARRDYLSEEQKAVYADVLKGVEAPAPAETEEVEAPAETPKKLKK